MHDHQGQAVVARLLYRPPRTRERCGEAIGQAASPRWERDGDSVPLAAVRNEDHAVLVEVVLASANTRARQAGIGWVFHPAFRGHGHATVAARSPVSCAFDVLGTHRLFARPDVESTASVRVCERLGTRREAHLVEDGLDGERRGSEYVYGALAHELTGAGNGGGGVCGGEAGAVTGRPVAAPVAGHPRHTFRGPEHETGLDGRCGPRDTEEDGHDRQRPRTETPYAVHRPRPADRQPFRRDGVPRVTTRSRRRRRGKRGSPPASPGGDWWGCQERSGKRRGCRVGDRPPRPLPGAAH